MRFGLALVILMLFITFSFQSVFSVEIPKPVGFINDFAKVMDENTKHKIELLIKETYENTQIPIVILTMPSIGDMDYNEYANLVYNKWGIGKKGVDKGVLIFVTLKERKLKIETGYGVEEILPDGLVGEIRDRYLVPYFKQGKFGEGLYQGVEAISMILQKQGLPETSKAKGKKTSPLTTFLIPIVILLPILIMALRARGYSSRYYGRPIYFGGGFGPFGGGLGGGGSFGGFGGGMSGGGGAGGSF